MSSAQVVWAGEGGHCHQLAIWYCRDCGTAQAYTWFTPEKARQYAETAAAAHRCIKNGTQYWHDGTHWFRTVYGGEGRVLLMHRYDYGWQPLDRCQEFSIELCGAYYAASQGGACDLPKGHEGDHHV